MSLKLNLAMVASILLLALTGGLAFTIRSLVHERETSAVLRVELKRASASLEQASAVIERFAKAEGVTAAEAARICGAEGSSAFDRGVAFGAAVCGAAS